MRNNDVISCVQTDLSARAKSGADPAFASDDVADEMSSENHGM